LRARALTRLRLADAANNSIGRITTSGVVSNYTDTSISNPRWIAAGPDGALWFTNYAPSNSIGRISCAPRLIRQRSSPACSAHH
jgi:streptogramin lyase